MANKSGQSGKRKKRKTGVGRPRSFVLNEETKKNLQGLARIQCTFREMAAYFDISLRTFQRACRDHPEINEIIENHRLKGNVSIRRQLFDTMNTKGHPKQISAAIYLSKNYLGMSDNIGIQHSGPDGGPVELAMRKLSKEERAARIAELLAKRTAALESAGRLRTD